MSKNTKDLIAECRKHGTTNGACIGYHNILFDEVADRLEALNKTEQEIKAEAYKEAFNAFLSNVYTDILPGSLVMPKNVFEILSKKFLLKKNKEEN